MACCRQPTPPLPAFIALRLQSDNPQNPHGLGHAWALLARLLNALPANRVTATAVDALLKVRAVLSILGRPIQWRAHHL